MIKDDMIKAISKYMEIDTAGLEIKITKVEDRGKEENIPFDTVITSTSSSKYFIRK